MFKLHSLAMRGVMEVMERDRSPLRNPYQVPKYVVLDTRTNRISEEFRRLSSAVKWANENRDG